MNDHRCGIKGAVKGIREVLEALDYNQFRSIAADRTAERAALRLMSGLPKLLCEVEAKANTIENRDVETLANLIVNLRFSIDELRRDLLFDHTLDARAFSIDHPLRLFLGIRQAWFSWIPENAPWYLSILRNLEREFLPRKRWFALIVATWLFVDVVRTAAKVAVRLWPKLASYIPW
jgi:hypothetical protein